MRAQPAAPNTRRARAPTHSKAQVSAKGPWAPCADHIVKAISAREGTDTYAVSAQAFAAAFCKMALRRGRPPAFWTNRLRDGCAQNRARHLQAARTRRAPPPCVPHALERCPPQQRAAPPPPPQVAVRVAGALQPARADRRGLRAARADRQGVARLLPPPRAGGLSANRPCCAAGARIMRACLITTVFDRRPHPGLQSKAAAARLPAPPSALRGLPRTPPTELLRCAPVTRPALRPALYISAPQHPRLVNPIY